MILEVYISTSTEYRVMVELYIFDWLFVKFYVTFYLITLFAFIWFMYYYIRSNVIFRLKIISTYSYISIFNLINSKYFLYLYGCYISTCSSNFISSWLYNLICIHWFFLFRLTPKRFLNSRWDLVFEFY